jgi:hypothetical protein
MSEPEAVRESRQRLLAVLIALGILSTALHYTHNFVFVHRYPPVGSVDALVQRIGIAVAWPLCTALLLLGYRAYVRGRDRSAQVALLGYVPLGLTTPLHFLGGVPRIPAFFTATIFTDFLTSFAILGFALCIRPAPRAPQPVE